jgi:hypothetical protein
MSRLRVIVVAFILLGCSSGAGTSTPGPTTAPSTNAAPASPCIDREQLADSAESVKIALEGIITALKAGDVAQARSLSDTAGSGLSKVADLVDPVTPAAAKTLRDAATKLGDAAARYPDGLPQVEEAEGAFEQGYEVARAAVCPA